MECVCVCGCVWGEGGCNCVGVCWCDCVGMHVGVVALVRRDQCSLNGLCGVGGGLIMWVGMDGSMQVRHL